MFRKSTLEPHMESFEGRARALREAVNGENAGEASADSVDAAAASVAGYVWHPRRGAFVRLAVFELSRAINEAPDRAIRVIIQNHQAYVLEALAERVLELEQAGDEDGGDGGDGGGEATPRPIEDPIQQAA